MARQRIFHLMALALCSPFVLAQAPSPDDADAQRRRLIEQKIRLVESLMAVPAAAATAGREGEVPPWQAMGKIFLDRVRAALAANRIDDANVTLDDALRNAAKPSNRPTARNDAQDGQQSAVAGLTEQVATYRAALEDLARQGNGEARASVARIAAAQAEAARLVDAGQWTPAGRLLGETYRQAIGDLSRLRAGQTVTLGLHFETPQAEYEYELKRFDSSRILVAMMIDEGRAAGERRNLVDGYLREGMEMQSAAAHLAHGGNLKGAISTMEKAVGQMNRALQSMGVPAF